MKNVVWALGVGTAVLAVAAPAAANEPRRLCGPAVELVGIVPHLDVEVNGQVYESPSTGEWSIRFDDEDGRFTVRYFNGSGDWGSTNFDVGPAQPCEEEQPAITQPSAPAPGQAPGASSPAIEVPAEALPATLEQLPSAQQAGGQGTEAQRASRTLPATGANSSVALLGGLLILAGAALGLLGRVGRNSAA